MPVFTYVASLIVAEVIGIAGAAILGSAGLAFVTSAIAVGLAVVTSRLINGAGGDGGGGGTAQDPGVRLQFPPATANKIPIVYGHAYQKGIITDARISNSNQTMTYVLQLSEKTQTGTFTVGDIFWNDQLLVFKSDAGSEHIVASSTDQNGNGASNTNYDGLIRVRVYSGNTNATSQIFPPQSSGNTVSARTTLDESDANYLLNDLVFAVIQIDYNSSKGVTGLAQVTFELTNSLTNPGEVWYDYITSSRYGVNVPTSQIDTDSCIGSTSTSLKSISNQIPANQYLSDGTTTSTQARYQINGVISTGDVVKNNLDRITIASAGWTTYDYGQGKWKIISNRAATAGELANAFVFNDDNILGDIGITATNLSDLYNLLEIEYASRKIRDQNDYFRAEIASAERNDLEPDNTLNLRLDLSNNALHAARIGLIELKQSRVDLIISFRADYSALQCQAGDIVKITTEVYGFNEKLFRLTKIREIEDEAGGITVEVTALQYNSTVYSDETLLDSAAVPGSGIPSFGGSSTLPAPSAPTITNVTTGTNAYFSLNSTINAASSPVNEVQWWYNTTSTGSFSYLTNEFTAGADYLAGDTITDSITILPDGTYYFKARTGNGSTYSSLSTISSRFDWVSWRNSQPTL